MTERKTPEKPLPVKPPGLESGGSFLREDSPLLAWACFETTRGGALGVTKS